MSRGVLQYPGCRLGAPVPTAGDERPLICTAHYCAHNYIEKNNYCIMCVYVLYACGDVKLT